MSLATPRYRLYVFDFDGTLADSRRAVVATYLATLAALDLPIVEPEPFARLMGLPLSTTFERAGMPPELVQPAVEEYRRQFPTVGLPLVEPFSGVLETLAELRRLGAELAVASSRGRCSLHDLLAQLGIADLFGAVVAEEDAAEKKPAPGPVREVFSRLGRGPEGTVVVGDTVYDLEMGRAAGCATCGVTYGSHEAEELAAWVTDRSHLLDRFEDVLGL